MSEFKIQDLVKLNKFPYVNEIFMIVGDEENAWVKASPFFPKGEKIYIEDGKDFILIKKKNDVFGIFGIPENGIHVSNEEIESI
ncbi:hypothetical protein [Flavobacterium sp.]|uniref:hypothetical protein n=1 Tax=Flavobacterium sp. TaxID=239 RepID=UPI0035B3B52B